MTISTERLRLDGEETRFALSGAAQAFCNRGFTIACPWEGDLDDGERERFDALVAAIETYNSLASRSAGAEGREAVIEECAKVADGLGAYWSALPGDQIEIARKLAAQDIATAIRALTNSSEAE